MMLGVPVIFTLFLQPMLITGGGPDGETYTIALYIVTRSEMKTPHHGGGRVGFVRAVGTPLVVILRKIVGKTFPIMNIKEEKNEKDTL